MTIETNEALLAKFEDAKLLLSKDSDDAKASLSKSAEVLEAGEPTKASLSKTTEDAKALQNDAAETAKALLGKGIADAETLLSKATMTAEALLARVKRLEGLIPICSYCHKIRVDQSSWQQLEQYLTEHSDASFSHGICPQCLEKQEKIISK